MIQSQRAREFTSQGRHGVMKYDEPDACILQNSYVEALYPSMALFGNRLNEVTRIELGFNRINAIIRTDTQNSSTPLHEHKEKARTMYCQDRAEKCSSTS